MFNNTSSGYGLTAILLHWLSVIAVFGLFGLGFWMVDLTYYSSWYQTAPHIHKSIGLLFLGVTLLRLLWKAVSTTPNALEHSSWEKQLAKWTHRALYVLLLLIMVSGILISTADGRDIWVFDWFAVPFPNAFMDDQADIAGVVHQYLAYTLIVLVVLHALGAIKHHLFDKDNTLTRMLKPARRK
ncbi:cytochrome b [Shewanella inventionis]|uniref:Cytochrome b n=1 Tax=Shewanella inventionis TaxID=1738770 RepID=A0ABQ1J5D1_9GAMM|nr:cytochrome b [Shewanella inventionis]MCL1157924.1 cytochrome b [Shewanella inventionis]UAL42679.1 cytochrome b [Shewanella inventionis]GGB60214.1 cytochrome b [Shewanella inventionis]